MFFAFARRPAEFHAFAFPRCVDGFDDGLSKAERELIVVATSARISVCIAWSLTARSAHPYQNPLLADQVAINPAKADLSDRRRHIVEFALKVADDSATVGDADLAGLRALGFTDDEIWDIGAITALFALSNRYANFTGMRPNDEFYRMAR